MNAYKHDGDKGEVFEVQKLQNRRNPQMVIDLANKIRTDGLVQVHSDDVKAPNMLGNVIKNGQSLFLYTQKDGDVLSLVRSYLSEEKQWNFHDAKATKELNLTHNLIAGKAGFSTLMEIYSGDPLLKYIKGGKFQTCVQLNISDEEMSEMTFGEILKALCEKGVDEKSYKPTQGQKDYIDAHISLFEKAKSYNCLALRRTYVENSQLVDDKKQSEDEESKTGSKRSPLVKHLCKIEQAIQLFQDGNVSEFLKVTGYTRERSIRSIEDKKKLKASIEALQNIEHKTIQEVIELADEQNICLIDDKVRNYKERSPYIYDRMMEVPYQEFVNLYNYLEGQTPFSTQHRTKGAEFNNVLVILDNGRWNNYNFDKLFTSTSRTESVVVRTEKIFYVCCTRAMERLAVFYHKPTKSVIDKAQEWFGKENVVEL